MTDKVQRFVEKCINESARNNLMTTALYYCVHRSSLTLLLTVHYSLVMNILQRFSNESLELIRVQIQLKPRLKLNIYWIEFMAFNMISPFLYI